MLKNKLCVPVHFVWATSDRQPFVTDDLARDLYRYIEAVCRDEGCPPLAVGGMPDHVHLLVLLSSTCTLAALMQHVKGGSSRHVTQSLRPGAWFAWQGSYGAFAVSRRHVKRVAGYIANQKCHHAEGTLWPDAEACGEADEAMGVGVLREAWE